MSAVEAVLFDWGGTLSVHADLDLLDMWRAAARVLAPEDPEPVAVDRLRDDISGAAAVGMRTVHLTGRPVELWDVVPDAELVTLDGLVELVDGWR